MLTTSEIKANVTQEMIEDLKDIKGFTELLEEENRKEIIREKRRKLRKKLNKIKNVD